MSDDAPLYTLDVARKIVKREACAEVGHEIERHTGLNAQGKKAYNIYSCGECDVTITMTYPPLEGE